VVVVRRPPLPAGVEVVETVDAAVARLRALVPSGRARGQRA
jgi:hypothetical protein